MDWPKSIAATLNTKFGSKMGLEDQHALSGASHFVGPGVRRLTPVECERLQGFPDGWTITDDTPWQEHPKPDGPRYAQMGNAVTVPVAEWIGQRIMEREA
jgi:DNA (cytosine-5)-methyltransferase 1